jgi:hypothetical protein
MLFVELLAGSRGQARRRFEQLSKIGSRLVRPVNSILFKSAAISMYMDSVE